MPPPTPFDPLPWAEFTGRILADYRPPMRATKTGLKMRRSLGLFAELTGAVTTADLTPSRLGDFVVARGVDANANTTLGYLRCLKTASNVAIDEGWLDRSPFRRGRVFVRRSASIRPTHFSIAAIGGLLALLGSRAGSSWCDHRLFALAATIAYTGLRRNEALCLHLADVDLTRGLLSIVDRPGAALKTVGSAGLVPIAPELRPVLAAWMPATGPAWVFPGVRRRGPWTGGPFGDRALDQLQRAGAELGMIGLTFHALRHSLATHAAGAWGLSLEQIRQLLRHGSTATTLGHYIHADAGHLAAAAARIHYAASASV